MFSRIIGFIICLFALVLPWRLRVILSEVLGWITQFFYYTYYGIMNYLLKELKNAEETSADLSEKQKEVNHEPKW